GSITDGGTYSVSGESFVSGATLEFETGAVVNVIGSMDISSGTVDFSTGTTITIASLNISGGTLSGSDTFEVTRQYTNTRGTVTATVNSPSTAPFVTAGSAFVIQTSDSSSRLLATFADDSDGPYTVTIHWGDGSSDTTFTASSGNFDINSGHSYSTEGKYVI